MSKMRLRLGVSAGEGGTCPRSEIGGCVLLVLLALWLYVPSLDFGLIADDNIYLGVGNNALFDLEAKDLWRLLASPGNPWEFLPIRDLSYWADARLFGNFAEGFHASNLFWYATSVFAAYLAARETWLFGSPPAPLALVEAKRFGACVTALFALHPAHVEAVAWVAGRKDILAALFLFLAWALLLRGIRRGLMPGSLIGVVVLLALGCLSKSTATVTASITMFVLLAAATAHRAQNRLWLSVGALVVASVVATFVALHLKIALANGIAVDNDPGFASRLERASRILAGHLRLIWAPTDMRVFHDAYAMGAWHWAATGMAIAAAIFGAWLMVRRKKIVVATGLLWLIIPLVAYLQFSPFSTWSMISERFVFVSTFGLALLLSAALAGMQSRFLAVSIMLALCTGYGLLTAARVGDWNDEQGLFEREAARNPSYFNAVRPSVISAAARQDWDLAEIWSRGVTRPDAREILLRLVAYLRAERRSHSPGATDDRHAFCEHLRVMDAVLTQEFKKIPKEKDLAYSSFLRNTAKAVYPTPSIAKSCQVQRPA